jgi:starvation-inducible DNA-binding protein
MKSADRLRSGQYSLPNQALDRSASGRNWSHKEIFPRRSRLRRRRHPGSRSQSQTGNVRGPTFIAIHELFDKVADVVEEYSDKIAERAGALGGTAEGTVQTARERSFLEPYRLGVADAAAHIATITAALASFGEWARNAIHESASFGDADTSDLFTEVSRGIDYQLWLVESHRQL